MPAEIAKIKGIIINRIIQDSRYNPELKNSWYQQ